MEQKKIKVVFVEQTALLGGAQVNQCYLQKYLNKEKFESLVVCPGQGPLTEELKKHGSNVQYLSTPGFISTSTRIGKIQFFNPLAVIMDVFLFLPLICRLARLLRKEKPDLVVTNGMLAHFYGGIAAKVNNHACVWLVGDIIKRNLALGFARWIFNQMALVLPRKIVAVSQAVKNSIEIDSDKVIVIHNGVDLEKFNPDKVSPVLKKEYGIPDDVRMVGVLGRLTPWKGHQEFIRAAAQIAKQYSKVVFFIVGGTLFESNNYTAKLKNLAYEVGLTNKVIFAGFRTDIPECIASLDICVLPSQLPEPFGLVLVESMAMKKAVIATNAGGVPEVVLNGNTGILIPLGDNDALAKAVLKLLENFELAQEMGLRGRCRVNKEFTLDQFIQKHEQLFLNIKHC